MRFLTRIPVTIVYAILALLYLPSIRIIPCPYSAVAKALPILLLIAALIHARKSSEDKQQYKMVFVALAFSILGDAAGEFKGAGGEWAFFAQIAFFSIAQLVYTRSFDRFHTGLQPKNQRIGGTIFRVMILFYVCFMGSVIMTAVKGTSMFLPVGVYMVMIASMALTSSLQTRKGFLFCVLGAAFFVASDTGIAYSAFVSSFPHRDQFVMWTYYLAQLLLNYPLLKKK